MIVGIKTERFISVQHNGRGYIAIGNEVQCTLNSTKGWRCSAHRRQIIGPCEKRDAHRAQTQGINVSYKSLVSQSRLRSIGSIVITEKMLMRHGWYRRQKEREARAAATEAFNNV